MLLEGASIKLGPWRANAFSAGSKASWLILPAFDLICDIGWCVESAKHQSRVFISHFHDDHCNGLIAWLNWRQPMSETPPVILTHVSYVETLQHHLESAAQLQHQAIDCTIHGLQCGDTYALDAKHTLHAFETDHRVPTLGCLLKERRKRLKESWKGRSQQEIRKAVQAGQSVTEHYDVSLFAYTSDTTHRIFDKKPELLNTQVLLTECTHLEGVLEYIPNDESTEGEKAGVTHTHIRPLARKLEAFTGEAIAINHIPAKYSGCDIQAYLLPRLPPGQREKLTVLPHSSPKSRLLKEPSEPPTWVQAPPSEAYSLQDWEIQGSPGPFGWQKAKKLEELEKSYPGYRIAWQWGDTLLTQQQAFQHYEDAYVAFLEKHPLLLDWLVKTASDVYDTAPNNTRSGLDYAGQAPSKANHFQDIAIRRALIRLGRWFQGDHLVEIRGMRSEGYVLNPGQVPFHQKEQIRKPEHTSNWILPGSIESFWQSNKVIISPRKEQECHDMPNES